MIHRDRSLFLTLVPLPEDVRRAALRTIAAIEGDHPNLPGEVDLPFVVPPNRAPVASPRGSDRVVGGLLLGA